MAFCTSGRAKVSNGLLGPLLSHGSAHLPVFLCPAALGAKRTLDRQPCLVSGRKTAGIVQHSRPLHTTIESRQDNGVGHVSVFTEGAHLPLQCAGCGALSQSSESGQAGFYTVTRRTVKAFLESRRKDTTRLAEENAVSESLSRLDVETKKSLGLEMYNETITQQLPPPVCDRCHKLLHHETGVSIHHPTIESLQDTIFETPHKYNHVYHIIDAADFPMSLVPGIHRLLNLTRQRSHNRRSKTERFYHGRQTEVSFIITRSDLLAPLKSQVDKMMPYLTETLRDALGSSAKDARLGNVRCVSAKRNWWTNELREDVWKRGGGGWMVGKVNVGKSQLFESVFPKGRRTVGARVQAPISHDVEVATEDVVEPSPAVLRIKAIEDEINPPTASEDMESLNTTSLLPPLPQEVDYPEMPLVSALPGTTASPIRVPFGNGKGELIDLPGLSRGDLEQYVQPEHRNSLVMRSRVHPEQQVIKPGQSLLLGGFIRITPKTPDLIFLAYAFTPIVSHLTSTEKAIGIQTRARESSVENIADPGVAEKTKSAGTFRLEWDVTKKRTGPLMAKSAANLKAEVLPYTVFSADILIEGCGWVELVAQVRKKTLEQPKERTLLSQSLGIRDENPYDVETEKLLPVRPEVEIFSPLGKFIGLRRPLGAWELHNERPGVKVERKGRPRKSMKGDKKRKKLMIRRAVGSNSML